MELETKNKIGELINKDYEDYKLSVGNELKKELNEYKAGNKSIVFEEDTIFKISSISGAIISVLFAVVLNMFLTIPFTQVLLFFMICFLVVSFGLFFALKSEIIKLKDKKRIVELEESIEHLDEDYQEVFDEENVRIKTLDELSKIIGEKSIVELFFIKNHKVLNEQDINDFITLYKKLGENFYESEIWNEKITYKDLKKMS